MKISMSILYIFFSFVTSYSFGNDKYNFNLKIIADDNLIMKINILMLYECHKGFL